MKRLLLPALLLTTLTACTATPAGTLPAAAPTPTPASTPAPTAAPAPADALTPEEKIGQLFIIRPDALDLTLPQETINDAKADGVTTLTDAMRETLQAYPVGGICQFGKNITDPEQLAQFNADLQAASRTPLFIAVDEEGGAVARLANHPAFDLPQYESAAAVGASGDPADACAMGQTIGAYLKEYGFNMDFAPVADVSAGASSVIGSRSFGTDAQLCASLVGVMTGSIQTEGIIPCLKHFPGYGSAVTDDHYGTSVLEKTEAELESCDFLPFAAGIEAGAPFVMVSHLSVPEVVGDETPSDLSSKIVSDLLRNKLGFTGVIITDSHQMASITDHYTSGEAAVKALQAGVDMILMPQDLQAAFDGVKAALAGGTLTQSRIDESVLRILQVKAEYNILQ